MLVLTKLDPSLPILLVLLPTGHHGDNRNGEVGL